MSDGNRATAARLNKPSPTATPERWDDYADGCIRSIAELETECQLGYQGILDAEAKARALNATLERLIGSQRVNYNNAWIEAIQKRELRELAETCF